MSTRIAKITRADGRSDSDVIIGVVQRSAPGTILTIEELSMALSVGSTRAFDKKAVQGAACRTVLRLAKEIQRALHPVRGVGYRVAEAGDHCRLANERKRRSDRQLVRGLAVLQNVRWSEMSEDQRNAHQGQLMVLEAVVSQQRSLEKRMSRIENAIKKGLTTQG